MFIHERESRRREKEQNTFFFVCFIIHRATALPPTRSLSANNLLFTLLLHRCSLNAVAFIPRAFNNNTVGYRVTSFIFFIEKFQPQRRFS